MPFSVDTSGLTRLRMKLEQVMQAFPAAAQAAIQESAEWTVERLAEAAPHGHHEEGVDEQPLEGDAPGPLAESFSVTMAATSDAMVRASVETDQPTKFKIIIEGRKEVFPKHPKQALFWPGLDHPVMHAKATEPNDFVTPVLQEGIDYARAALDRALSEALSILNE